MRLHIGPGAAEQLLGPLDGQGLDLVDEFAAAVIALAGIAFGVFVGQHRTLRFEHGAGNDVFRGDQLDLPLLARELATDHAGDGAVTMGQIGGEKRVGGVVGRLCGDAQARAPQRFTVDDAYINLFARRSTFRSLPFMGRTSRVSDRGGLFGGLSKTPPRSLRESPSP